MIYKIYDEQGHVNAEMTALLERATEVALQKELGEAYRNDLPIEISISVVDADEMYEINAGFRGVESVTDVLSFPQYQDVPDLLTDLSYFDHEILLGDVVICFDKVREQAEEYGHSLAREFIYLYVHSIMHLLGYDHMQEDEKTIMRAHEEAVMADLGLTRSEDDIK